MATDAKETKKQENGSRIVFESVIERGKFPTVDYIEKNAYENMPASWLKTFELQANAIKKYVGGKKRYNYSRDKGIMPFLERIAKDKMGVSVKDRWNPMDIVMVIAAKEKSITKKIEDIGNEKGLDSKQKLSKLNLYMKDLLKSRDMIPISLKALSKGATFAKLEEANLVKKSKGVTFKLKPRSVKCNLDMTKPPLLDTGEFSLDFYADDQENHLQIRNFQYSKPQGGPQTDITPRGGGAKLGKSSSIAIEKFLQGVGLSRPMSVVNDPMINVAGKFTKNQIDFWVKHFNKIKRYKLDGEKIKWDMPLELRNKITSLEEIIRYAIKHHKKDRSALGRLTSKLHCLRWVEVYYKISQKGKFNEWLSALYYGAKKEFGDMNGPFIKIY